MKTYEYKNIVLIWNAKLNYTQNCQHQARELTRYGQEGYKIVVAPHYEEVAYDQDNVEVHIMLMKEVSNNI